MTPDVLRRAMPYAGARADTYADPLTTAMRLFSITTPQRQAAFIGNVAAETASLSQIVERTDGAAYENDSALGNTDPGDGFLYRGRGLLQVTGRANYAACGQALHLPLILSPQLLEEPANACMSAAWFWSTRGLNELADQDPNHFAEICRKINGGYNGIDERIGCWITARKALGL